jgi:hypothetical protein
MLTPKVTEITRAGSARILLAPAPSSQSRSGRINPALL